MANLNRAYFFDLAQDTLRQPRKAAAQIIALQLPRDVLWTGLALVAVFNTVLVYFLAGISSGALPLPSYFDAPLTLFMLLTGVLVVYIHALYWTGLALGGQGALMDVLALFVWFNILRAVAQSAVVVLTLAIPAMGLLLSLVVAVWGLWIILNFIAAALNLPSAFHGLAVMVIAAIGAILGLGIILSLIGLGGQGAT